ncbi:F-box only protein 40 isoform X1 [Xyrauchen texanus]|uniref:F-box only protein 40 isoform X1 n=1 Tax=Xyrauchen texanus TaxID=154827 RepID=UPI0022424795|nr:F-box only protein 40 isoform X1 [Xyrauchen texanus]
MVQPLGKLLFSCWSCFQHYTSSSQKGLIKSETTVAQSRYRRTGPKLHRHCDTCYSRHCKAPIEISMSCMVINCHLLCGATFHMCKEDEHSLLCPNENVPCLNANFGCPFTMCRFRLAKHLEVCPASIVCCSMEWNRWPVENPDAPLYINVLKEIHEHKPLDLSMALRDQKHLCARLKMRSCFPELMEEREVEPTPTEEEGAVGGEALSNGMHNGNDGPDLVNDCEKALNTDTAFSCAIDKEKYNLFEMMFSMERGGCKQAEVEASKKDKKGKMAPSKSSINPAITKHQEDAIEPERQPEGENTSNLDVSKTGLAPWQDGVLERLGQQVNPREFNMYIVHHGRMLISFGQMDACTPRERDFVYGNLEPIPVQTLRTFKVPSSYKQKRIQFKDTSTKVMTEDKNVGTSDFGEPENDGNEMDEIFATLLCSAEAEIRGHKISETVPTDGLYVDIATQTYNFSTTPFKYNATLSEVTADRDLKLHVQLDTETVSLRHNKTTSAFTFLCGHFFRRDEFAYHFKNVHSDIQSCLSGWFEQRCPLAYLGCTFSQQRLQPATQTATVFYNQDLSIFSLRPEVPVSLTNDTQTTNALKTSVRYEDYLSNLPFEVLCHIAGYLDSFTLSQLALVSGLFRNICATLLQGRGMVAFKWQKKTYSHGGASWKPTVVWEFSSLFSKVGNWCIGDTPSMAEHLKHCPFYQTELKTEPFSLTSNDKKREERHSLVTLLMGQK